MESTIVLSITCLIVAQTIFVATARNAGMGDITFMDCWHFIAPLIPKNTDFAREVYVMTFKALKDAEEHRKKNEKD